MKFMSLRLHNFGAFKGRHEIDFNPIDEKPLVLIGALNGSGKTTVLEAIQLAMFGKLANISEGRKTSYEKMLKRYHNIYADDERMSLELEFTTTQGGDEGEQCVVSILRSFRVSEKGVTESIKVYRNGEPDDDLAFHWHEFISQHIPVSLSSLFFFDGERIAEFASSASMPDLIRQGIESLLGLDTVNTLIDDLNRVCSDIQKEIASKESHPELDVLEEQLANLNQQLQTVRYTRAEIESKLNNTHLKLNRARREAEISGYDSLKNKDELHFELQHLEFKLHDKRQEIAYCAAQSTPLFIIKRKIQGLREELLNEEGAKKKGLIRTVVNRYSDFLGLNENKVSVPDSKDFDGFVEELSLELVNGYSSWYDSTQYERLMSTINTQKDTYKTLVKEKLSLERQISRYKEAINRMPSESEIQPLIEEVIGYEQSVKKLEAELNSAAENENELDRELESLSERYNAMLKRKAQDDFDLRSSSLTLDNAKSGIDHLRAVKKKLLVTNISQIEKQIGQFSEKLFRKPDFINQLSIDQKTYSLTLYSSQGKNIELDSLSAGERQLLVVSILWSFIYLSGRDVPIIIDTPLGRLDGRHRKNLLKGYFPNAAEQVILLSTDQEVRPTDLDWISESVSQTISLSFNDKRNTTEVNYEYFH